jgi:hypothetical protein
MMTHDEMIAVIQHHKDGGKIEYITHGDKQWRELCFNPLWNFATHDYRIKPEPRSLWVVRFQSGNIASCYERKLEAICRFSTITNATIHEYKEVTE